MRPTFRKVRTPSGVSPRYQAVVEHAGRLVAVSARDHPTIRAARRAAAELALAGSTTADPLALAAVRRRRRRVGMVPLEPVRLDGTKPAFRRTFVERFLQCTEYEADRGEDLLFGGLVHVGIHMYWKRCVAAREETRLGDLDEITREAWRTAGSGIQFGRYEEFRSVLDYFARNHIAELDTLMVLNGEPAVEVTLAVDAGWCVYTCTLDRADRVDGDDPYDPPVGVRATDYKTAYGARVDKHNFQRRFYAQMLFLSIPTLDWVDTAWDPIRSGSGPDSAIYQRGDLDQWWADMDYQLRARWDGPRGRPTGGASCSDCALRTTCGAATLAASGKPDNSDQMVELVGEWLRTKERAGTQRDALKLWFERHAPATVNGMLVGFLPPVKQTWRASDAMGIMRLMEATVPGSGKNAMVTWIDPKLVSPIMRDEAVQAGVARYDPGRADFKARRASPESDDEEAAE